jgi:hypothetical protein
MAWNTFFGPFSKIPENPPVGSKEQGARRVAAATARAFRRNFSRKGAKVQRRRKNLVNVYTSGRCANSNLHLHMPAFYYPPLARGPCVPDMHMPPMGGILDN